MNGTSDITKYCQGWSAIHRAEIEKKRAIWTFRVGNLAIKGENITLRRDNIKLT